MLIHGIGERKMRILQQTSKDSPDGTPVADKRGKFPSPQAIDGITLQCVHEHIATLPLTARHYSRATTPHQRYLESGSSISELYFQYLQWMINNRPSEERVTEWFYLTVFTRDYNIVFSSPKTDVCTTCEKLDHLNTCEKEKGSDVTNLEAELAEHKASAKVPRDLLQQAENSEIISNKYIPVDIYEPV